MFKPWKGSAWGQAENSLGGLRLLVLGESHYCDHDRPDLVGTCASECTKEVVEKYALIGPHRFFTGLTQVLAGREKWKMSGLEVRATWASIAFYNYVPVFVATGPRIRPRKEMWEAGQAPFVEVFRSLDPQVVLVCGNDLWWWLRLGWFGSTISVPLGGQCNLEDALALHIRHPSAIGFSWRKVRGQISQALTPRGIYHVPTEP